MPSVTGEHRLQLYNTLTRERQPFVPLEGRRVKIFTCGPSIYGIPHIGNYRTFLYEDVLQRYLEYLGYAVERVVNFTDVEDKAIARAGKSREKLEEITEKAAEEFFRNTGLLHIRVPDFIPRSSTSVDGAVEIVGRLLAGGYAYRHGDDIFYDPLKFAGFGKLFGLDMTRWPKQKKRFRLDTYEGKRWNRGDFILWHGYRAERDGDIFWETELGRGRPAWNVQDAAMIFKHLGLRIDIACGGIDNLYRHHDYTIAIMEPLSGRTFANYWLHGEHVLLNGKKMSKSKGNILYPLDLLDKGMSAVALRYYLIAGHYRQPLNLTEKRLKEGEERCRALRDLVRQLTGPEVGWGCGDPLVDRNIDALVEDFEKAMNDDLGVGAACAALHARLVELVSWKSRGCLGKEQAAGIRKHLLRIDAVLQILFE